MTSVDNSEPNQNGRKPDSLDEITDFAWRMLEAWKNEVDTRAYDDHYRRQLLEERLHSRGVSDGTKRLARLHIGSRREVYHSEAGLRFTKNMALEKIAFSIGEERWAELAGIFTQLPSDFTNYVQRPRELLETRNQQIVLSNKLASMLDKSKFTHLDNILDSPFSGLLAKQVLSIEWYWALRSLRHSSRSIEDATHVAKHCLLPLYLADITKVMCRMLRGYAKALKNWKPESRVAAMLQFAYGKLNEREFVKRIVFFLLSKELKQQRAPNKETALIVNLVLGLRGKNAVTANDITQMNKRNRRRYFKEAESYVTWRKELAE